MMKNIHEYIKTEETNYALPVQVTGDWEWSMKDHIELSVLYKNSTYKTGKDDQKPFKNITRPILNLQYRAEGFDVKDIVMYLDDKDYYYMSFLVRKFYHKWALENEIDEFIDKLVESYVDFGGVLVKKTKHAVPEVIPMQSIAFCDQTDILSGPICIKHFFSPNELLEMSEAGWGEKSNGADITLEDLIVLAQDHKVKDSQDGKQTKTPGKYIEIYETHGNMPDRFLKETDKETYCNQMHITGFYKDEKGNKQGVTLFKGKEKEPIFELLLRDEIYGRALGLGGAEELFEPQVWVNYDIIRLKQMLDHASKVIYKTTDSAFTRVNDLKEMDNGDVAVLQDGDISQIDNQPRNLALFENNVARWEQHAQQMGSASDPIMGEEPKSGTPFALQELVVQQARGQHEYRKGKIARFVEKLHRKWIIPYIAQEVSKEQEFLALLDLEEMQEVVEKVVINKINAEVKELILNGIIPSEEELAQQKIKIRENFMRGDGIKVLKILKGEMKKAPINLRINIAGKQEYLAQKVDKLVNVFRQVISAPQILANPSMAKLFNNIIEASGLEPLDFSDMQRNAQQQVQAQQPQEAQLQTNQQ